MQHRHRTWLPRVTEVPVHGCLACLSCMLNLSPCCRSRRGRYALRLDVVHATPTLRDWAADWLRGDCAGPRGEAARLPRVCPRLRVADLVIIMISQAHWHRRLAWQLSFECWPGLTRIFATSLPHSRYNMRYLSISQQIQYAL